MNIATRLILLVALLALASGVVVVLPIRSYDKSQPISEVPKLKVMDVVDVQILPKRIRVAAFLPKGADETAFVTDILTIYKWDLTEFKSMDCGDGIHTDICRAEIWVLFDGPDVPIMVGKSGTVYQLNVVLGLGQLQIDRLLEKNVSTLDDLVNFHQDVINTDPSQGIVEVPQDKPIFEGFK